MSRILQHLNTFPNAFNNEDEPFLLTVQAPALKHIAEVKCSGMTFPC